MPVSDVMNQISFYISIGHTHHRIHLDSLPSNLHRKKMFLLILPEENHDKESRVKAKNFPHCVQYFENSQLCNLTAISTNKC